MPKEYENVEATPEQKQKMAMAEHEISQTQYIEYRDKVQREPESQIALDKTLLETEAKTAMQKKIIPTNVKMPDGTLQKANMVLNLETKYSEPLSGDLIKGNYSSDSKNVWGNAFIASYLMYLGNSHSLDLSESANFFYGNEHLFIGLSRGRGGFADILTKTDKHVSEGVVQHFQQQLIEKKKKTWGIF